MSTAGFICRECGCTSLSTKNSRMDPYGNSRRRRMTCKDCGYKFSTIEVRAEFARGEAILDSMRRQVIESMTDEELLANLRRRLQRLGLAGGFPGNLRAAGGVPGNT